VPNVDVPSLRSVNTNLHAPVAPGTDKVGDSEVETHELGVITAPKCSGVRSPVAVVAGSAGNVVGSPALPPDAERSFTPEDEHAVARRASERPTDTIER
jgi:hypothetical protein